MGFKKFLKDFSFYWYDRFFYASSRDQEFVARVELTKKVVRKDLELILKRLTCLKIIELVQKKKQTSWQVVLALDKNPFMIATTTNEEKYQFKILEDSKFSEPQNLFDDLKFAANQYLMVSQCGLDLLVNRLVPDTPEFRSEKNDWIAYDGLEAAKNILHTRMIEDRKLA